ncbi:MAG: MmcQ/YjbR family DNA-binding protein [Pseudomonadota bacterium]
MATSLKQLRAKLRDFALSLPETSEALPWGERVVKVNKKVFLFMGRDMDPTLGLGLKLSASHAAALSEPSVTRMGYGLGKSGWVSAKFDGPAHPPFAQLRAWVCESYCAVAPKKLGAQLGAAPAAKPAKKAAVRRAVRAVPAPGTSRKPAAPAHPERSEQSSASSGERAQRLA